MTEHYQTIDIKDIQTNPYQPRQHFDSQLLEELAQSIKENGIIQPLIVRPSSVIGYQLMAGERRLRAAQLAGLTEVPVLIKKLTDQEMMSQAIIENLQRQDLNAVEEARAYQKLIDKGSTHDAIAQVMGKSRPYISNTVRLLNLPDKVIQALEDNRISQAHARQLLSLNKEEEQLKWLEKIVTDKISVHQLERLLKDKKTKSPSLQKNIFLAEEEEKLSRLLGTDISLSLSKQGQGHIKIHFSSLEEFERLINILKKDC